MSPIFFISFLMQSLTISGLRRRYECFVSFGVEWEVESSSVESVSECWEDLKNRELALDLVVAVRFVLLCFLLVIGCLGITDASGSNAGDIVVSSLLRGESAM